MSGTQVRGAEGGREHGECLDGERGSGEGDRRVSVWSSQDPVCREDRPLSHRGSRTPKTHMSVTGT